MRLRTSSTLALVIFALLTFFTDLQAEPKRVFVSGSGNDLNPCSILSPCRSFQRAHDALADGGEIVPLGSAGYGGINITKSISIVAPDGIYAGITGPEPLPPPEPGAPPPPFDARNAVFINGAGISVYLRGLSIIGAAGNAQGVTLLQAARLVVDRCQIRRFGTGIVLGAESGNPVVTIQDSILEGNFLGLSSSNCLLSVLRCTVTGNSTGLALSSNGIVLGCEISGGGYGITLSPGRFVVQDTVIRSALNCGVMGVENVQLLLTGSTIYANGTGIDAGPGCNFKLVGTKVEGNTTGLYVCDGAIQSGGQNLVTGNATDGTFSSTFSLQ